MIVGSSSTYSDENPKQLARTSYQKVFVSLILIGVYIVFAAYNGLQDDLRFGIYLLTIPVFASISLWLARYSLSGIENALYLRRVLGLLVILAGANFIETTNPDFHIRVLFIYPFIYFIYLNEFTVFDRLKFTLFVAQAHIGVLLLPTDATNKFALLLLMAFASTFGYSMVKLRETNLKLTKELAESANKKIYTLSHFDPLTGLANQFSLTELDRSLQASDDWNHRKAAVLAVGIDRFKAVNETLGHHVGDQVLKELAKRLKSLIEKDEVLTRFNGDQFHITFLNNASEIKLFSKASAITESFARAFEIGKHQIMLTSSIGIAMKNNENQTLDELQRFAEFALHEAKLSESERLVLFDPSKTKAAEARFLVESELRIATASLDQFELNFQPIFNLQTGKISSAEALLRWNNPKLGMVSPDNFIPVAESTGLIIPIGYWVFEQAISALSTLIESGVQLDSIGINLSAGQLHDPKLISNIESILMQYPKVSKGQIDLELTESAIMSRPDEGVEILQKLRYNGMTLSIDDFGVAYSSLNYLKRLPANCLKIDRSFITDLCKDDGDLAIVSSTIVLAHTLGLEVLAEGVETIEQQSLLKELGCDEVQGFGLARPLPYSDLLELLLKQHREDSE